MLPKKFLLLKNFFDYNLIILKEIVTMAGIWNHTIVDFIEKKTSEDVRKNFVGVFSSHYVTRFVTFCSMTTETGARYPFIIMNADHCHKKSTHWWSFLDLHLKENPFYLKALVLRGQKNFYSKAIEKR